MWASTKDGGKTIVANFNDHNPAAGSVVYGGAPSYSKNGGATFKEVQPPVSGHGDNLGDPIVVFNSKLNLFFMGDLVAAFSQNSDCAVSGGDGIGLWTSPDGINWTVGSCPHVGVSDDRESMWVDNNPASSTYGRMFISWNDFANNGALSVVYSDNGTSWTGPIILSNTSTFMRDVQITGSPRGAKPPGKNSTVFVASMDEGGGGNASRQNVMFRSTDGGNTWTSVVMGPRFNPPGDASCASNGYFYQVNPIWRHMGWGEPGVGPNSVVHYAYAGAGSNGDHGDIFYTRSTDNGQTWSKAIKLNTDKDAQFKTQWMPSLSATGAGKVTVSWYDRRKATSACNNVGDPGCNYERVGRQSKTNGASWGSAVTISTAVIPQPAQNDPGVVSCYAGDYDYNTALGGNAYVTWTDGRRKVGGVNVQDVDFAKVPEP